MSHIASRGRLARLLLAGTLLTLPVAPQAGLIENTVGGVFRLLADISGAVTSPFGDLLVGVAQTINPRLARAVVRIQGRYLTLVPGTAAFDVSFTHDGVARRFVVIRPEPAYSNAPVLLMLHGNGGTPENQGNLSEAADLVAARGVWVVLPEGIDGNWNGDPANSTGVDDVGFITDTIGILTGTFETDPARTWISGLSMGAFMAERYACERSDLVAASALISGTLTGGLSRACTPAAPRPILFMDGTADPIVPYNGGRIGVLSAPDAFNFWLTLHNCDAGATSTVALPDTTNDGTTVSLTSNNGCGSGKQVRLYTIDQGGHAWPGGWQYLPVPVIGRTSTDIDATTEIWNFVSAYSLP
ncbi:MAG: alpha/beta hydrolase family esterase [Solimonas sp.]